jgi:uncharacterized protein (DUF433 family)
MIQEAPIGIGYYTAPEASRLLKIPVVNIRRWLGGYTYIKSGERHVMPPLWEPQLPGGDEHIELGFRDLIELRFVQAFIRQGLSLFTIRNCLSFARECVEDDRPFSTRLFKTDGRTIFLDSARNSGENELLDLKRRQFAIKTVIEQTFRDLEIEAGSVKRWRPFKGRTSIIIDPEKLLGQPIAAEYGVPTVVLDQSLKAEGSIKSVARLYEVSSQAVKDAVAFEKTLAV